MTVQHGGYLYEQSSKLDAPLQLLTQILWHLVSDTTSSINLNKTVLLLSLRHYTEISSIITAAPLHLSRTVANYGGNAAVSLSRPQDKATNIVPRIQ